MNKSELKNLINEAISEAMTESAPPKFPRALEKKLLAQYKDNPAKAACADREEGLYESTEEAPLYVEYMSEMPNEEPFMMGNQKFQFVNAKYPNGRKDIGVYAFSGDVVYAYDAFRKMYNIKENHDEADMSNPEEKQEVGIAKKMKKHIDAFLKMHGQLDEAGGETDMSDPAEKKEVDHATEIKKLAVQLLKMHGK